MRIEAGNDMTSYLTVNTSQSTKSKLRYACQGFYGSLIKTYRQKDEWGKCANCGKLTRFNYHPMLDVNSSIAVSCGWDEKFTEEINLVNTLNCFHCHAKFRVRCVAESLLKLGWKGQFSSISDLVSHLRTTSSEWLVLETASTGGIFSNYEQIENVMKSEYFDDVDNGDTINGIYSEDLQSLTLNNQTLDALISLDVFEHIADPWKAFSEVERVLKPKGIGLITVPIDTRNHNTQTLVKLENNELQYLREPSYHIDPLRQEGTLVFTEFGTDIVSQLRSRGHKASFDTYRTKRTGVTQFVIIIEKSD